MNRTIILTQLRERIVSFAASRMMKGAGGAATEEDVAQETLLVLEEKYSQVEALEDLVPLAMQIARYKIMALHTKSLRRGESASVPVEEFPIADPAEDPEALLERRERLDRLETALLALGDRCRDLFRLKLQGLRFPEIQHIMGAESINTVYTWDLRCRKQLLERMKGGR
ncbi:MAG: sigma-70 family RNA polymerase sigma factor [Acidobacteria bacterium]|nr:sigma-70 family RNA polymerase sigma factor [Acidobacteriota bacterium]